MKTKLLIALCLLSIIPLSGCGSSDDEQSLSTLSPAAGGPLLPLPDEGQRNPNDPNDTMFMNSVAEWLQTTSAPANSQYQFTRIDLDGDGMREGIALFESPYQEWCIEYGCTMFIFQAHEEGFSYLSEISPIRGPLVVTDRTTNGWRDIMAYVSGRSAYAAKNVSLKYNGNGYPMQPALEPAIDVSLADMDGVKIFP